LHLLGLNTLLLVHGTRSIFVDHIFMEPLNTSPQAQPSLRHNVNKVLTVVVKAYKGSPNWVQWLGHYTLLSGVSLLSPIFTIIQGLLMPYVDITRLTANPTLAALEVQRLADYMILHPTECDALRLGLVFALLAHLLYMLVAWRGLLWLLRRSTHHIQPNPKPFKFEPW
jgi:hypothetical protein